MDDLDAMLAARASGGASAAPAQVDPVDAMLAARASASPTQKIVPMANRYDMPGSDDQDELHRFGSLIYGGVKGAADLVQAPAQLFMNTESKLLGSGVLGKPGPASQWIINKSNEYNDYLKNQENEYQRNTQGGDSAPAGIGRITTGAIPFLLSGGAEAAPAVANTVSKAPLIRALLSNGAKGAGYGTTTQPVTNATTTVNPDGTTSSDFFDKKQSQAETGFVGGNLGAFAGHVAGKLINPQVSSDVSALLNQDITPTAGQILGGGFQKFEDKMTSVPVIGDMIKNSQRRAVEDFNRAAYNRALAPINEQSTAPVGREAVAEVKTKLGNAYDSLIPKLSFNADQQFGSELTNLSSMMQNGNVPPAVSDQFHSILKNEVLSRMTPQGNMSGQSFKDMESAIGQQIKRFGSSPDPNNQAIASGLGEVLSSARANLTRSNPVHADELNAINQGYANYTRIRSAASSLGAETGVFTPAQLQNAVKAQDKSVGKGNFATGNALMQDLSEPGKGVLGSAYPDSGTVGRALATLGTSAATAGFMTHPLATGAAVGAGGFATLPYTKMGQKVIANLLAKRPAGAESAANAVEAISPTVGAALTPAMLQILSQYLQ